MSCGADGTGVGIGLFLLLIAANGVGLVAKNPGPGLPVALGHINTLPALVSIVGLAAIFGLERRRVPGSILIVIVALSAFGLAFDPGVTFIGIAALPSLTMPGHATLIGAMDLKGALSVAVIPSVLARSEEHTSELQSLMRISYAVFCLKKKTQQP